VFGIVFVVAGLAFKLGVVPFHMWVPDVYQGSPTAVTLLLGGAPKIAAFAICIRLLVEGLTADGVRLAADAVGAGRDVAGDRQPDRDRTINLKRMLAYSTIAQMGFVLLGLLAGVVGEDTSNAATAYSSAMYYSITYVLTTVGTFGLIMLLARAGFEAEELSDFKGLAKRSPWFATVMSILLFSLAGVPPMMGFAAKFSVLQAVLSTGAIWLTVLAVMFSLIGAFYYIRVVKIMWFDEPTDTAVIAAPFDMRVALSVNGIAIVVLGLLPGSLLTACLHAMTKTLAS
jgi:NADH-quinone oxidoreductase subunit N